MSFKSLTLAACLSVALLGACATTLPQASSATKISIAQADERVLGYFSADGTFSQIKSPNGYTRKLLGRTADGLAVVQDFYSTNGKAQTAPFVLFDDAGLTDWDSMPYTRGEIVFYHADGKLSSRANLDGGDLKGKQTTYHINGKIFQEERYDDQGNALSSTYFDDTGKRIFSMTLDPENTENNRFMVYDAQDQAQVSNDKNSALVEAAETKIAGYLNQLSAHSAKLAGQDVPDELDVTLPRVE